MKTNFLITLGLSLVGVASLSAGLIPLDPAVRYSGFESRVGTWRLSDRPGFWNFDPANRAEAQDAYFSIYAENNKVPFTWTGNTATLTAGEASPEWRQALYRAINYQRFYYWGDLAVYASEGRVPASYMTAQFANDPSVVGKTTQDAVQAAALVMAANKRLGHDFDASWIGYTPLAVAGGQGIGSASQPPAGNIVESFIVDYGASNYSTVGHRKDIFDPSEALNASTAVNGTFYATAICANDLTGFASFYQGHADGILGTWPQMNTYVPYTWLSQVVSSEGARFSASLANVPDISGASVTVKRNGAALAVSNLRYSFSGVTFDVAIPDIGQAPAVDQKYDVTIANVYGGKVLSYSFTVFDPARVEASPAPAPRTSIVNLSTRGIIGGGENVIIAGFIIGGNEPVRLAVRAQGPSLKQFGIQQTATNPKVEIFVGSNPIGSVTDWKKGANWRLVQSFSLAPKEDADPVAVVTLMPGAYTAVVSEESDSHSGGVGIVELFNIDGQSASLLSNVSTRGLIGTGEKVMIGGLILRERTTMLVRTQGPSLSRFGIAGPVHGTTLQVFSGSTVIAENKGWRAAGNERLQGDLAHMAPTDEREAASVITLDPGAYTFKVESTDGVSGVGLIEIFKVESK